MRYLRMLTNTLLAGLLAAAYLTILVLQLNPDVPLNAASVWQWFGTFALLYGTNLAAFFYALIVLRQLVGLRVLSPGWISLRLQAWFSAALASGAAMLMWLNQHAFAATLGEEAARRMTLGAVAMTASALVLLTIAVAHYSFRQRGSMVGASLLGIGILASIALPIAARGIGQQAPLGARRLNLELMLPSPFVPSGRVVMILLDGASLEYIWPRVAEGRFPNFGKILDSGAALDLATLRPTQPEPVWAAVATGKYPPKNGVRSAARYRVPPDGASVALLPDYCFSHALVHMGFVTDEPENSASWRARPLWDILDGFGIPVGIVRWPLTYPAKPLRGFVVSDRLHVSATSVLRLADESAAWPTELTAAGLALLDTEPAEREVLPAGLAGATAPDANWERTPARWDRLYRRVAEAAVTYTDAQPRVLAVRYQGLDPIGHAYLRYALPRAFGDVSESERERYGAVLDRYYSFIDARIGSAIEQLGADDLLLVISGFGMQPVSPTKRLLARLLREPDLSGTHERAPDGFLLAYGAHVSSGKRQRGSIVDVAPTVLYYLGLPVGRDMDGFARADIFSRAFIARQPVTFIATHER